MRIPFLLIYGVLIGLGVLAGVRPELAGAVAGALAVATACSLLIHGVDPLGSIELNRREP